MEAPGNHHRAGTNKRAPRAAKVSTQAKAAAQVTSAEAHEEEEKLPALRKKRGRPKKVTEVEPALPMPFEEDVGTTAGTQVKIELEAVVIDWTEELTWMLIAGIEDDEDICDGLFPGIGSIGLQHGKPKAHWQHKLAVICFATNPDYQDAFAVKPEYTMAVITEQRKLWTEKISNKLKTLVSKGKTYIKEMGATGAGIVTQEEVQPGTAFATRWDEIMEEFLFFFRLRTLIAARPNLVPVGIANNDTGFDVSLLMRPREDDDTSSVPEDTRDLPEQLLDGDEELEVDTADVVSSESDTEIIAGPTLAGAKRKLRDGKPKDKGKPPKKIKGPQLATSVPAAAPQAKKTANAKELFASTVKAEEETAQRGLVLKSDKNKYRSQVTLAKIQMESETRAARADAKKQDRAAKMELVRLKMQHEHEYKMAQLPKPAQAGPSSFSGSFSHQSGSGSPFPSDSYRDYELPRLPRTDKSPDLSSYSDFGGFSGGGYQAFGATPDFLRGSLGCSLSVHTYDLEIDGRFVRIT
ncbi:hypothetical protein B0H10DRAFT_2217622 [Mycena sp. CBHHK59/15]|nr:hypothetical protein B0H10DRAFT_2217622 [Mycena sp. CBHHK59/15]